MSFSQNTGSTMTRTGFASPSRTLNLTSPEKPEARAKIQAQDLRLTLKDRMSDLAKLQSEWGIQESSLRAQCEDLVNQLRDLDYNHQNKISEEQVAHLQKKDEATRMHQEQINSIQNELSEGLSGSDVEDDLTDYDNEINQLKAEIAKWEDQPLPTGTEEIIDDDADERIRRLEERYEEMQQTHEEALQQREDDSKDTTSKIEQLINRGQEEEASLNKEISDLVERLTSLDEEHNNKVKDINHELADEKQQIANSLKNINAKTAQIQKNIAKKQRAYNHQQQEFHDQIDSLRSELESFTTRQKQQLKEAAAAAKAYAEVKRRFVSMHKELEMLNSEKVREIVEHETLMKGLNKMDNYVLSQMSASATASVGSGSRNSASRPPAQSRGSTSMFGSSRGSKY